VRRKVFRKQKPISVTVIHILSHVLYCAVETTSTLRFRTLVAGRDDDVPGDRRAPRQRDKLSSVPSNALQVQYVQYIYIQTICTIYTTTDDAPPKHQPQKMIREKPKRRIRVQKEKRKRGLDRKGMECVIG